MMNLNGFSFSIDFTTSHNEKLFHCLSRQIADNAAMETIRLACPLHLQHPISTSELAIYVPIVYSLAS